MKKLAMIGCNNFGGYHLDHLVQFKDIELAGFCDVLIDRAEGFVKKAGSGKAFSDFVQMYDEIKPDMLYICVPPNCHGRIEFEAIHRGIPFYVEKPLALDADLARELVRQVEKAGLIAASGFQCRYDSMNVIARKFIKTHPILHVSGSRIGGLPKGLWGRIKTDSGGQLVEQTIHQMDMMRYLLEDEPDTVYSVASRGFITQEELPGYFTDDFSTTLVTFKSGITATMLTGYYALSPSCWDSKMVFGSRTARMDYRLITDLTLYGKDGNTTEDLAGVVPAEGAVRTADGTGITVKSERDPGLESDRTFVDAVISGDASKIRSPYADAWKSVAFCLACNESMRTGQSVKVKY